MRGRTKKIKQHVNNNGVTFTYTTVSANIYYYYGDDVELDYDFASLKEIEKVFGKSIDDIDSEDLMQYESK